MPSSVHYVLPLFNWITIVMEREDSAPDLVRRSTTVLSSPILCNGVEELALNGLDSALPRETTGSSNS